MNCSLLFSLLLAFPVCSRAADLGTPTVAVITEGGNLGAEDSKPKIVVGIWPDGRIIWSRDSIRGGPPYLSATIPNVRLAELLGSIEAQHLFGDRYLSQGQFGPDSAFTTIWVQADGRRLKMRSWHELYETNPKVVALSNGLTALGGRTREDALRADKKDYQRYRSVWANLRKQISTLIPSEGEAYPQPIELELPEK